MATENHSKALSVARELASVLLSKRPRPVLPDIFKKGPAASVPAVIQSSIEARQGSDVPSMEKVLLAATCILSDAPAEDPVIVVTKSTAPPNAEEVQLIAPCSTPTPSMGSGIQEGDLSPGMSELTSIVDLTEDLPKVADERENGLLPLDPTVSAELVASVVTSSSQVQGPSEALTTKPQVPLSKNPLSAR